MAHDFVSSFDLIADPSRVRPPYGFYGLFFFIGLVILGWASLAIRRHWRGRKRLAAFATIWLSLTSYVAITDAQDVMALHLGIKQHQYETVEGCLRGFHPGLSYGTKGTVGDERWSVDNRRFSYGAGEVRPGYHLTEPNGGVVHRDSKVRVSFITTANYGRTEIVKLAVIEHACPSAVDEPET